MFHTYNKSCIVACLIFITLVVSVGTSSAYGLPSNPSPSQNPGTFLPGSTPYGVPYNDWTIRWWQWNIQIPKEQHPETVSSNLIKCPVGESGSVSFLTESLQGQSQYSCTIPAGHAIMIPISPGECTSDEAKSSVPADMAKCATVGNEYLTFDVTVDGVRLNGLDQQSVSSVFNLTVPKDNFLDLKPGTWQDVTGNYFAFLKPLTAGNHNVSVAARVTNPFDPSYNYNYHNLFLLKVQ